MLYWCRRLVAFLHRRRLEQELREEIEQHLELREQQLLADGAPPCQARRDAVRRFGSEVRVREAARDLWGFPSLDSLAQDVRYGARLLRRSPGFTGLAVLSLALGMGAAAAVFNVADAVLFRELAVTAPHELREFRATLSLGSASSAVKSIGSVPPDTLRLMGRSASFARLAGFRTLDEGVLSGAGQVRIELVSDDYFDVLGVATSAGRLLGPADASAGIVPVVISERLWRSRFSADPAVTGRSVRLNDTPAVVVGVARAFRGVLAERPADVMVPAALAGRVAPASAGSNLRLIVRLRPGVSVEVAEQRMASVYKESAADALKALALGADVRVTLPDASRGASDARETLHRPVTLGLVLVGVLLLVACANTGGLLLARFTSRAGEFALRMAIGAGRVRLARQLVVEAMLLAAVAAVAGVLIAAVAAPLLLRCIPLGTIPPDFELRFDWRLVAFTGAMAAMAALVAAGASLVRLVQSDGSGGLISNGRTIVRGRRTITETLIAIQVACALLLLVATGGMARTLINLGRVDPGFDPSGVIAITVDATGRVADSNSLASYHARLRERLSSSQGVSGVSFAQVGLMTAAATTGTVEVPGWSPTSDEDRWARMFFVGPDFFESLRMPILAGVGIGRRDAESRERVAVVNRAFAEFYFGGVNDAVGRIINRDVRVVGVTVDARYGTLRDEPVRAMFVPHMQAPSRAVMTFVVRTSDTTAGAVSRVMAAVRAHDPGATARVAWLDEQVAGTISRERFVAGLAAVLSGLALLLSCAGLYGSVAGYVAERRGEIALRVALGARATDIVRLAMLGPLRVTLVGVVVGVPCAWAVMRAAASLLFDVAAFDIPTVAACVAAMTLVASCAALLPARRAARVEPRECLSSL